jgi:hypothetical protein
MADRKISDLTALTTPASGDFLPIVDISEAAAASKNKRITIEELMRGVPDGTAAAPGIAFETDPNTGIYRPGADQLAVATNGTGRLFVDASGNVGINNPSPAYYLDVTGHIRFGSPNQFFTELNALSGAVGQNGAYIRSAVSVATNPTYSNADDQNTGIFFPAADTLAASTGGSERLRITSAGLVGIGTSSPNVPLDIESSSGTAVKIRLASNTSNRALVFSNAAETIGWTVGNGVIASARQFVVYDNEAGAARLLIDSSGRLGIGTTTPTNTDKLEIQTGSLSAPGLWVQTGGTTSAYPIAEFRTGSNLSALLIRGDGASVFSGKVLVGTSTSTNNIRLDEKLAVVSVGGISGASFTTYESGTADQPSIIDLQRSRGSSDGSLTVVQSGDTIGSIIFRGADGSAFQNAARIDAYVDGTPGASDMPGRLVFSTTSDSASGPTERMRINNLGETGIASASTGWPLGVYQGGTAGTSNYLITGSYNSSTPLSGGTRSFGVFTNGNVVNTNNSYGAISDIKLKENIVDASSQWDDLKALQVRNYNFKEGQTHTQIGLVAQEAELVSPGLVSESPDRDEEGNDLGTVTKSVNYSVLYMKAVKALQEAMERIEQLEAKVAALESA